MITWRKSRESFSNGNCVEVGQEVPEITWRKSSASNPYGSCVEAGQLPEGNGDVLIRDTKDEGQGPVLRCSPAAWRAFTAALK